MSANASTLPLQRERVRSQWLPRRARDAGEVARRPALTAGAALFAIVLCELLIVLAAASGPSFLAATARAEYFPRWMAGPLDGLWPWLAGGEVLKGLFTAALGVSFAAYLLLARRAAHLRPRTLLAGIVIAQLVFVLGPPLALTDVFNYLDYARMEMAHHLNPYTTPPVLEPHADPAYALSNWHGLLSPYGPLFTIFTFAFTGISVAAYLWTFKAVLLLCDLGIVLLTWRCAELLGREPRAAVALVALNPVVLVWGLGADHNDFLVMFFVMLGLYLTLSARAAARAGASGEPRAFEALVRRLQPGSRLRARATSAGSWLLDHGGLDAAAGAAFVVAAGLKASAGILIPIVAASALRQPRRLIGLCVGVLGTGALAMAASLAAFGWHFPDIAVQDTLVTALSLPNLLGLALGQGGETNTLHALLEVVLAGSLLAACVLAARRRDPVAAAGWAMLALIATLSWVLPWYVLWLLPFSALAGSRRLRIATALLGVYLLIAWLPTSGDVFNAIGFHPQQTAVGRVHARAVKELLF